MGEVAKEVLEFARYIEDHYPDQDPPADDPVVKKFRKKDKLRKKSLRISSEEQEILKNLFDQGLTYSDIADKMNRSESTIKRMLANMDLNRRRGPARKYSREYLQSIIDSGITANEAAHQDHNICSALIRALKRAGLFEEYREVQRKNHRYVVIYPDGRVNKFANIQECRRDMHISHNKFFAARKDDSQGFIIKTQFEYEKENEK